MMPKALYNSMKFQLGLSLLICVCNTNCNAFNFGHSYRHNTYRHNTHRHHPLAVSKKAIDGYGAPSNPGWSSGRLNRLTEWADSSDPNRPIICEYNPQGRWLWRKWNGTVLKATWKSVVFSMLTGFIIDYTARGSSLSKYRLSWDILSEVPTENTPFLIKNLSAVTKVWEYQLTLSTFILTFFLSQAFSYWQKVYNTTRMIQGRINGEEDVWYFISYESFWFVLLCTYKFIL